MSEINKETVRVEVTIDLTPNKVWEYLTKPEHIVNWNFAIDSWCCPSAENDLKQGGKFSYRMEAKDGSFGFDFWGIYTEIIPNNLLKFTLGDDRKVQITLFGSENKTILTEDFEAENQNPVEMQKGGWQAILNNLKIYAESKG